MKSSYLCYLFWCIYFFAVWNHQLIRLFPVVCLCLLFENLNLVFSFSTKPNPNQIMAPGNKPGINGATGYQKGLSCESCHSEWTQVTVHIHGFYLDTSSNILYIKMCIHQLCLLLLQLPSLSSGMHGALPTCSADSVPPVGFTGRSMAVLRPLLN